MHATQIVRTSPRPAPLRRCAIACAPALLALALPAAQAQLVDGGFDINPLTTIVAVINTPNPMLFGVWGQESATLVGVVGPVSPLSPTMMLSTTFTSGIASQTAQAIDVLPFAGMIASGANFTLSANFNALNLGPIGGIVMQFFASNTFASQIGVPVPSSINVDGNPATWENLSITGLIPAGTQSMLAQVLYSNASLITANGTTQPGYVDSVEFRITPVPEPGAWVLLMAGGALMTWRLRRQSWPRASGITTG